MKTQNEAESVMVSEERRPSRKLFSRRTHAIAKVASGAVISAGPKPTHFETVNASARQIFVAGSFNGWRPNATPLQKQSDGKWTADLSLQPGSYEYRFVVDGEWSDDAAAANHVKNPFGGTNAVVNVAVAA